MHHSPVPFYFTALHKNSEEKNFYKKFDRKNVVKKHHIPELREMAECGGEAALFAAWKVVFVGLGHGRLDVGRGKIPDLERVVHTAWHDFVTRHAEVRTQHLVPGKNN